MKNKRWVYILFGIILVSVLAGPSGWALPQQDANVPPIVILVVDKLNSHDLFERATGNAFPGVKRLLAEGACGLMNIRSGGGYTDTASGYLSLGAGGRSLIAPTTPNVPNPPNYSGAYSPEEILPDGPAGLYLRWSFAPPPITLDKMVVPQMGALLEQAKTSDFAMNPGLLGELLHQNGWGTELIGNLDNDAQPFRPGGLIVTDRQGGIDGGNIASDINEMDSLFPNQYRFSAAKTMHEVEQRLTGKKLIVIDFGDFYRLDYYQDQMLSWPVQQLRQDVWHNFDQFVTKLLRLRDNRPFSLMVVAPSVSKEAKSQGNLLAPVIIQNNGYPPGLLTSGTTKWTGLVANIDFIPTLAHIGGLASRIHFTGRTMQSKPTPHHVPKLLVFNQRLATFYLSQRPLLDWFMGLITVGWIGALLCFLWRKKPLSQFLLTMVMVIPWTLLLLALAPEKLWTIPVFLGCTLAISGLFFMISDLKLRVLLLSGITWGTLLVDQLLGWHLIRFSALGYSAVDGSRYYGMGNECMGLFLAVSLLFAHLVLEKTKAKGPVWVILGASIGILTLPQFGAKFGGIIAGTVGILYYMIQLYQLKIRSKRVWIAIGSLCLILLGIGLWDSIRPPEVQTHIGRFFRLFWTSDFGQIAQIVFRKINMDLKLTWGSPWMRITLLAIAVGWSYCAITKRPLVRTDQDSLLWRTILVTGITAYLVNDAGVLALATCLAFGFSYILLRSFTEEFKG